MALKIETPPPPQPNADIVIGGPGKPPAAAPAPAAPAKPAEEDTISTEGIEQLLKESLGPDRYAELIEKPKGQAPKPEPGETKGADKKPDAPAKGQKPTGKPSKPSEKPFKPKVPQRQPATPEQIASATAEAVTKALTESRKQQPGERADKPTEPELAPEDQKKVEILTRMEQLQPTAYKGISQKYKESIVKEDAYIADWEKNHPGETFDDESPEHDDFYKKNAVEWSDEDYTEALADIRAEKRLNEATQKTNERLEELDRQEKLRQRAGEIRREQTSAAQQFWQELDADLADMIKPDGTVNPERVNALKEANPEAFAVQVAAAERLDAEVEEIWKLYQGLTKNDPDNNEIHRTINSFAFQKEKEWTVKPIQEKLNREGKSFVTIAQYQRMTKAQREEHWCFNAADLSYMRAQDLAAATKRRVEAMEEQFIAQARRRGLMVEKPDVKPESPSSGGESRMAAVSGGAAKTESDVGKRFLQEQLHGK